MSKFVPRTKEVQHFHRGTHCPAARARFLLLAGLGFLSPCRRVPRPGTPATPQSRHVQALPRRREGASRPRGTLCRRHHADARRRRRQDRAGTPRAAARLPGDRELPRSLAEVSRLGRGGRAAAVAPLIQSRSRWSCPGARCGTGGAGRDRSPSRRRPRNRRTSQARAPGLHRHGSAARHPTSSPV